MTARPPDSPANPAPLPEGAVASWSVRVADELAACKIRATEAEIARLAKTLARLQETANAAMAQPANGLTASFTDTLQALAHGR